MRLSLIFALILTCAACSVPQVNVKNRWNAAMVNYSFVPLYPARGDVEIGDIRIHTIEVSAEALDSRLISKRSEHKLIPHVDVTADAVLPGIESFRLLSLDTEATGLSGTLQRILGSKLEASNSLYVSLQKLKTAEIADKDIALKFHSFIATEVGSPVVRQVGSTTGTSENEFVWGLCAAAKTLGDPEFKKLGISVVTRVITAQRVAYYSGRGLSNVPGQSARTPAQDNIGAEARAALDATKNENGNSVTARSGSSLPAVDLPKPVVVGVDALMLHPAIVVPSLPRRCEGIAAQFEKSQLNKLRERLGSGGGRR